MVYILALVLHHDEQAELTAVELALADGVPAKTHVLNLLHRLVDCKFTGSHPLDTPQALSLNREPRPGAARGSVVSPCCFLQDELVQGEVGNGLPEPGILKLQLLQPLNLIQLLP